MDITGTISHLDNSLFNLIVATLVGILVDRAREKGKRLWWGAKIATSQADYFGKDGGFTIYQNGHKKNYQQTCDSSLCRFVFWSSGRELVNKSDVSESGPLLITFDYRYDIYSIENIVRSNPTIKVAAINLHQIKIDFEYLEPGEGAVFDIFYAGNNAEPHLDGILKGGKINIKKMKPPDLSHAPRLYLLFGWLQPAQQVIAIRWFYTIGFIFLLMLVPSLPILLRSASADFKTYTIVMTFRVALILFISAGVGIYLGQLAVVPKKLRQFYENIGETNDDLHCVYFKPARGPIFVFSTECESQFFLGE